MELGDRTHRLIRVRARHFLNAAPELKDPQIGDRADGRGANGRSGIAAQSAVPGAQVEFGIVAQ